MINTFKFPKESETNAINRIKTKLQVSDSNEDELLKILYEDASNLISTYLNSNEVPAKLTWIAEEITIKRYRKIGSEGLKSEQIDVIANTFDDNPLTEYMIFLKEYKSVNYRSFRLF